MMYSTSTVVILGLASLTSGHMIMNTPVPYGKSTLNNSPLLADGTDFPCKQRPGVYDAEGANNMMALGSSQELAFTGSATHGGGSCQVSITYDKDPTKSSVFKVIHSIEGGCPIKGVAGNNGDDANAVDPDTYTFTIPSALPTGSATLAWTWFNKIGNREMYMNCAPITITAAASKRSDEGNVTQLMERDAATYNALPNMFVANIGNGCTTQDSTDLEFPDPGDSLDLFGTATATPSPATGTGCATATVATGSPGVSSDSPPVATSASTSAPSSALTSASQVVSSTPQGLDGVFATVISQPSAASPAPTVSSTKPAGPVASSINSTAYPSTTSTPSTSSIPLSTGTSSSGPGLALTGACSTEGMWSCIKGSSFQQCASGTWSVVQPLAAGTSCTPGQSNDIDIAAAATRKRLIRFSDAHRRRHLHRS